MATRETITKAQAWPTYGDVGKVVECRDWMGRHTVISR